LENQICRQMSPGSAVKASRSSRVGGHAAGLLDLHRLPGNRQVPSGQHDHAHLRLLARFCRRVVRQFSLAEGSSQELTGFNAW